MRLYPKKLRSIEDLEKEKKLLVRERQRLEEDEFLSVDSILGKGTKEDGQEHASVFDFLPISNPIFDIVVKMAKGWFSNKSEASSGPAPRQKKNEEKKGKSPLRSIAVEIIGGYLKWKAIELSFKGIRHILKKRRENSKGA